MTKVRALWRGDLLHLEHDSLDVAKPVGLGEAQLPIGDSTSSSSGSSSATGSTSSASSSSGGRW